MLADDQMARRHDEYQRRYYARADRRRIVPVRTPYVERHLRELLRVATLRPGARILEVGAGMGRFTLPLHERGFRVVASDLSPELLADLRAQPGADGVETIGCDAAEVARHTTERFDAVVGFFVLHHVRDLVGLFRGLGAVLVPGGRLVFAEPNAFHLPFYLQIAFAPGMTWAGDGGIRWMRPGVLHRALREAGFTTPRTERYGFVPPALANRRAGRALERVLEGVGVLEPMRAFQIVSA